MKLEKIIGIQKPTKKFEKSIDFLFSVKMQILQDSSRASLPSGRRFTRRPPYNTSMTLICQIEAEGYSLSEQLNILPINPK